VSAPTATTAIDTAADTVVDLSLRGCTKREPTERERLASALYERLHPAMALLGVLFLVLVLAQASARDGTALRHALVIATWVLWSVFVAEYVLRLVIAPRTVTFLKRTWWQLLFLVVPVFSILRAVLILRVARPTRVLLAAVRSSRSASRKLTSRLAWLALFTAIVVFTTADLVYEYGDVHPYGRALHAAAKAAIAAEAMPGHRGIVQLLDVVVGLYSIVVFAALAGTLGAYFLERRGESRDLLKGHLGTRAP
jgi:voltage-gated potassium channel